ncbi:hypothetical protein KUCAC02_015952, partial [Chaenocephalus aceratus]
VSPAAQRTVGRSAPPGLRSPAGPSSSSRREIALICLQTDSPTPTDGAARNTPDAQPAPRSPGAERRGAADTSKEFLIRSPPSDSEVTVNSEESPLCHWVRRGGRRGSSVC